MKNQLLKLLVILFVGATIPQIAFAEVLSTVVDGISYKLYEDGTAEVDDVVGDIQAKVEIPATVSLDSNIYNVTKIGSSAFRYVEGVDEVIIPSSVIEIEEHAFSNCSISNIDIPPSVNAIGNYAFEKSSIRELTIPSSVTSIGYKAFNECWCNYLFWYARLADVYDSYGRKQNPYSFREILRSSKNGGAIFAYSDELDRMGGVYTHFTTYKLERPYKVTLLESMIMGLSFKIEKIHERHPFNPKIDKVLVDEKEVLPEADGTYTCYGLKENTSYKILVKPEQGFDEFYSSESTDKIEIDRAWYETTQKSLTIWKYRVSKDASTGEPVRMGVNFNNEDYDFSSSSLTFEGLRPETTYIFIAYVYYGNERFEKSFDYSTYGYGLTIDVEVSPTTAKIYGGYKEIDSKVVESGFESYGEGKVLEFSNLVPETRYFVTFYIINDEGEKYTRKVSYTTPSVSLTTLQPKGVSETCAIVAAETNISDEETNVGFQWKKYDAPASLQPSEGYAAIYDGMLEGYLRNLQPTSYYNVRAFYKSAAGNYYYGDWVTFDPSDFSYFEPTVHTYEVKSVTHNTADVRGYVIAGTDEITEQGFEYWTAGGSKVQSVKAAMMANEVTTILAKGQVMTATLDNLQPETEYCIRAFVKTATGTTYGEEQTFTTGSDPLGVEGVEADTTVEVEGWYDLNGRRYAVPQRGINIVRYTDGTVRKIMVK